MLKGPLLTSHNLQTAQLWIMHNYEYQNSISNTQRNLSVMSHDPIYTKRTEDYLPLKTSCFPMKEWLIIFPLFFHIQNQPAIITYHFLKLSKERSLTKAAVSVEVELLSGEPIFPNNLPRKRDKPQRQQCERYFSNLVSTSFNQGSH